jgi:hypothetical protein
VSPGSRVTTRSRSRPIQVPQSSSDQPPAAVLAPTTVPCWPELVTPLETPNTFTAWPPVYSEIFFNNSKVWSGWVQDKEKVWPNLTLSFGLRYDYKT